MKKFNSLLSSILILVIVGVLALVVLVNLKVIDNPLYLFGGNSLKEIHLTTNNLEMRKGEVTQLETDNQNGEALVYTSSDTNVASVNEVTGYVKALNTGTATITVSLKDHSNIKDECVINVIKIDNRVKASSISLSSKSLTLTVGGKKTLYYTISPKNAKVDKIMWSTSNSKVATIDKYGTVTAVGEGTATIKVRTDNELHAACTVTVKKKTSSGGGSSGSGGQGGGTTPSTPTYKLTYNANGGSVSPASKTMKKGSAYGDLPTPTRSGYKFDGWYTAASGGRKVDSKTILNGNTIIYAHWTKSSSTTPTTQTFTLTYNANGGSVSPSSKTLNKGQAYGTLPTPTRSGYTFNGWYTAKDGGSKVSTSTTINANTTIYAHWTKNETPTTSKPSKIHFMNTGASDAIIIESNGHYGLVDSSNPYNDGTAYSVSSSNDSVNHVVNYLNSLGVKYLDFVVGTHSHSDHIGGMRVIASKFVNSKTTYYYRTYTGTLEDTTTNWDNAGYYNRAITAMKNAGANLQEVTGKTPTITLGDFSIKLMNTGTARSNEMSGGKVSGENKNAIVQYITYKGKHKTLLAADMEKEDEMDIANAIGSVVVLKIGHHSSSTSSTASFISKLSPKVAVITNSAPQSTFTSVGNQIQNLGGKVYVTGKATDAVVVEYKDSTYSVSPSSAQYSFSGSAQSSGEWKYVDGKGWMLYKDGKYVYNDWYQDANGVWYYMNSNGVCVTGWQELTWNGSKNWYYFKDNCAMVSNTCMTISGEKFCFNSSGQCTSGRGC